MPIYIVRWPDLSASFVQSENEAELLDILDQVGNADDCEWSVYDGPLFIDFRLPVEWTVQHDRSGAPIAPQQVVIGDISGIAAGNVVEAMHLCLAEGDDGYETGVEVVRLAFPKLHAAIESLYDGGEPLEREEALPEAELRKALSAELDRFLAGSWRRAQLRKKTDAASSLALEMDVSVKLARKYEEMAGQGAGADGAPESPENRPLLGGPLFQVSNHHTDDRGQPPAANGDEPGKYYGYFANEYGEQSLFMYNYEKREAFVRMGDMGWDDPHRVVDGCLESIKVTEAEAAWIRACWLAVASGHPTRKN